MKFTLCNATTRLDQSIGQSRFSVVDMGNNAEIPNVFHAFQLIFQCADVLLTTTIIVNDAKGGQGCILR